MGNSMSSWKTYKKMSLLCSVWCALTRVASKNRNYQREGFWPMVTMTARIHSVMLTEKGGRADPSASPRS